MAGYGLPATVEDQRKYSLPAVVPYNGHMVRAALWRPSKRPVLYDGLKLIEHDGQLWIIAPLWVVDDMSERNG